MASAAINPKSRARSFDFGYRRSFLGNLRALKLDKTLTQAERAVIKRSAEFNGMKAGYTDSEISKALAPYQRKSNGTARKRPTVQKGAWSDTSPKSFSPEVEKRMLATARKLGELTEKALKGNNYRKVKELDDNMYNLTKRSGSHGPLHAQLVGAFSDGQDAVRRKTNPRQGNPTAWVVQESATIYPLHSLFPYHRFDSLTDLFDAIEAAGLKATRSKDNNGYLYVGVKTHDGKKVSLFRGMNVAAKDLQGNSMTNPRRKANSSIHRLRKTLHGTGETLIVPSGSEDAMTARAYKGEFDLRSLEYKKPGYVEISSRQPERRATSRNPRAGRATVSKGIRTMHKTFQGRDVSRVNTVVTSKHTPDQTFKLGGLSFIKVKEKAPYRFNPNKAFLAGDSRRNLHIAGVRFTRPVQLRNPNDFLEVGPIEQVGYVDHKNHIGDGKTFEYVHTMGEDGGELPTLYIDFEGYPVIGGGSYDIQDVGIVN
jgi:hypothetical protein